MTPADIIALIEAVTSAVAAIRSVSPEEVTAIEKAIWTWFHRQADEPARLAPDFAPMLAEARDELMAQARTSSGQRAVVLGPRRPPRGLMPAELGQRAGGDDARWWRAKVVAHVPHSSARPLSTTTRRRCRCPRKDR